jgi:hypothetical protein
MISDWIATISLNDSNGEAWFFWGTIWIFKYHLDELRASDG